MNSRPLLRKHHLHAFERRLKDDLTLRFGGMLAAAVAILAVLNRVL